MSMIVGRVLKPSFVYVLVEKVQASIINFFLLDLKFPVKDEKASCFRDVVSTKVVNLEVIKLMHSLCLCLFHGHFAVHRHGHNCCLFV